MKKIHLTSKERRNMRSRSKIAGSESRPRICVFRSNKHMYVQAIDDVAGKVVASSSDLKLETVKNSGKISKSVEIAKKLAVSLTKLKIESGVFDRNGYKYHGRVKAVAEELRNSGIKL